jgi:hypothetical protein
MKRFLLVAGLAALILSSINAATVSFMVIETGLSPDKGQIQSSSLWESGMMDVFFNAGHIVSNAPIMRLPMEDPDGEKLPEPARSEFDEARNGGADFFIVVLLSYPPSGGEKPQSVCMRIFSVADGSLLYESSGKVNMYLKIDEEFNEVRKTAAKLVPQLKRKG